jgi:arsenate reductase (glutaredoxin)
MRPIRSKPRPSYDDHDLQQSELRQVAQHARNDPAKWRGAVVIEYLKNPPSRARLVELIAATRIPVRALLREKGAPSAELGLGDPKWSDDELIDFMIAHPILINRPIVETPKGVWLRRPSEKALDPCRTPKSAGLWTAKPSARKKD